MTATEVIHADHEQTVGIHRLAWADHVVPPALATRIVAIKPGYVMRGVERVTYQHRVGALCIELTIGLITQMKAVERRAAFEGEPALEAHRVRRDDIDGI